MTSQVIPAEAVEAALETSLRQLGLWGKNLPNDLIEARRAQLTVILEAAAPHMLAAAWDEGREADDFEVSIGMDSNPYRKATRGDD